MRRAPSLVLASTLFLVVSGCPRRPAAPKPETIAATDAATALVDAAYEAEAFAAPAVTHAGDAGGHALEGDASPPVSAAAFVVEPTADAGASSAEPRDKGQCREQAPQDFLIRGNFVGGRTADDARRRAALHQRAIRYRTEQYGYVTGFGKREWNPHEPAHYAEKTTFMGLPVTMHKKVIPALRCVEAELKRACKDKPYKPSALAGIRFKNTYRGGEVTNHAYAVAIDIDPSTNTCCGCVAPWNSHPACKRASKNEYDRMAMPECWVHVFERFGFYWLGHDVLKDTMHFEFLGDPEKILK